MAPENSPNRPPGAPSEPGDWIALATPRPEARGAGAGGIGFPPEAVSGAPEDAAAASPEDAAGAATDDASVAAPTASAEENPQPAFLGRTTGSDESATESGVDLSAGDNADATSGDGSAAQ